MTDDRESKPDPAHIRTAIYARAVAIDPNYAGISENPAGKGSASLLIRTAYQAIRVDDSIVQVQGDRAYLARSEERRFPGDIQDRALRKLRQVDAAATIEDLRNPPSSKLEVLKGNQAGQMSIRINDQWRFCFRWLNGDAADVEIVDCHLPLVVKRRM